jgi:hypothetical protein
MIGDQARGEVARNLLLVREARQAFFKHEIFDEYAWNMLLHLFVALSNNEIMSEDRMVALSGGPRSVSRRWLSFLVGANEIFAREDGDDIAFTPDSAKRMRLFLDRAAAIHGSDSNGEPAHAR